MVVWAALATGCPGPDGGSAPAAAASAAAPAASNTPAPTDPTAPPPLGEAAARRELARRFRAAGYRILVDVPVHLPGVDLVADGFDPQRGVGYEYVAAGERGLELDAAARARLAHDPRVRILVIDAAPLARWSRSVDQFLSRVAAAPGAGTPVTPAARSASGRAAPPP